MSRIDKYIQPDWQNPEHEDKASQILRAAIVAKCTWLQYAIMMTHRIQDKNGKEYPAYFIDNTKDYAFIVPDTELQSISFFELNGDIEFNTDTFQPTKYPMSFVCWYDKRKVLNNITEDPTNLMINQVIKILNYSGCENISKTTDFNRIFNYSGIDNKALNLIGGNLKAFKINFNYYMSECYLDLDHAHFI